MPVEICSVSGYTGFGKNMTAVKYGNEVVIIDMGIHPENYIRLSEEEDDDRPVSEHELVSAEAIPDISVISDWKEMVKGIAVGHAHLDHCGAVPYLAGNFNAPVFCTPFSAEVIKTFIQDRDEPFNNRIVAAAPGETKKVSDNIKIEFIKVTHSTPQSSIVAVHTPEGSVVYACDFKFDETPTLGEPTDMKRLKELGKEKVLALIVETTNGNKQGKTPSELVAREMLEESVKQADNKKNGIVVSTFSSHIARLKSILEIGEKNNRKVIFFGRSLAKYIHAAENAQITKISDRAEIVKYGSKIEKRIKEISREGKNNYLIASTGHQGEPRSVLYKLISKKFLDSKDYVIFSCRTIPSPTNIENRERIERELTRIGVQTLTDIHQSGHASQEELIELLEYLKPDKVLPSHGHKDSKKEFAGMMEKKGYGHESLIFLQDGDRIKV